MSVPLNLKYSWHANQTYFEIAPIGRLIAKFAVPSVIMLAVFLIFFNPLLAMFSMLLGAVVNG